ncbi:MAG: hypothetical protein K2X77_04615 [Candidatus Obscuribacterales bacterium]|nr:hypothetical protein [Candidatus Obscuribacterales bacterium]
MKSLEEIFASWSRLSCVVSFSLIAVVALSCDFCAVPSIAGDAAPSTKANAAKNPNDSKPIYSPDGSKFVFIRTSKDTVSAGNGDVPADVIFFGEKKNPAGAQPLFKKGGKFKSGQQIGDIYFGGIESAVFSPDSSKIYFLNAAYAVSGAIVEIDLKSRAVRYVIDGNSLEFAESGKYKGNLLVARHKYNDDGAYNVLCVVSPAGKEIKELSRLD